MSTLAPEELFLRFRASGDRDALAAVFEIAAPRLAITASRWCRDAHQVDDIVQETFLRAIRRSGSFDPARCLMGWLHGILRRVAREQFRHLGRHLPTDVDPADDVDFDQAQESEALLAIAAAVREVPITYRDLLQRRILQGQRAIDIARELRLPIATVRSKLQRGLRMLRQALPFGIAGAMVLAFSPNAMASALQRLSSATDVRRPRMLPSRPRLWLVAAGIALAGLTVLGFATLTTNDVGVAVDAVPVVVASPPPSDSATEQAERVAATRTVRVRGSIDFGGALPESEAVVVALPAPADCVLPLSLGFGTPAEIVALVQATVRTSGEPVARAVVARDGSFALDLPTRRGLLFVRHPRAGLVLPRLVHAPVGAEQHDVGMLHGYIGRCVRGQVPPELGIGTVTVRCDDAMADPFGVSTSVRMVHDEALTAAVATDGSFTIPQVWPSGRLLLSATDSAGTLWWSQVTDSELRATDFTAAAATLRVQVVDAQVPPQGVVAVHHSSGHVTRANVQDGAAWFDNLLPGLHQVEYRGVDGTRLSGSIDTRTRRELVLHGAGLVVFSGRVQTNDGAPVAGAKVLAGPMSPLAAGQPMSETTTSAEGFFRLRAPVRSHVAVDVGDGRFVSSQPNRPDQIVLEVPSLREVRGYLPELATDPELAVLAFLVPATGPTPGDAGDFVRPVLLGQLRAKAGMFTLNAPASRCSLLLQGSDHRRALLTLDANREDFGELAMHGMRRVVGTVTDVAGHGAANALVVVKVSALPTSCPRVVACRTDAAGRFSLDAPEGPGLELVATGATRGRTRQPLAENGAAEIVLALQPTGTLRGRVLDPDPEEGQVVLAHGDEMLVVPIDPHGCFEVTLVPVGSHQVTFARNDGAALASASVTLQADEVTECRLAPEQPCRVAVTLPPAFVVPPGASLWASSSNELRPSIEQPLASSMDLELWPGKWQLQCFDAAGAPIGLSTEVCLDARGCRPRCVHLQLTADDVRGEVRGGNERPVLVIARRPDGSNATGTVFTDQDGKFCFQALAGTDLVLFACAAEPPAFAVAHCERATEISLQLQPAAWLDLPADRRVRDLALLRVDGWPAEWPGDMASASPTSVPIPSGRITIRVDGREHTLVAAPGQHLRLP